MAWAKSKSNKTEIDPAQQGADLLYEAETLGVSLPALMTTASRVAHTVAQGLHGRRRAGLGETFWQFRAYREGDTAGMIDWRKSARTERLYIREREWEAVNTIWLWVNPTTSMQFQSKLANTSKRERALVLSLAIGDLLVRGGERIGAFASGMAPSTSQNTVRRMAEYFINQKQDDAALALPPSISLSRFSSIVMFSDFYEPIDEITERLTAIAGRDVHGHLVQIVDPAEETLPYKGRTQFLSMKNDISLTFGRIEELRTQYRKNFENQRLALRELTRRIGWTFSVHRTDAPPQTALLTLYNLLADTVGPAGSTIATQSQMANMKDKTA